MLPTFAAVAIIFVVALVLVWIRLQGAPTTATAPSTTPTGAPTNAPMTAELVTLETGLASSDPAKLAEALGLDTPQLTPEIIAGFGTSDLAFESAESTLVGDRVWDIPVTITGIDGVSTSWLATVVDTGQALILADTRVAQ